MTAEYTAVVFYYIDKNLKGSDYVENNSEGLFNSPKMGEYIEWLIENNITHEGILMELIPLDEFVEYLKLSHCDEPALAQLPKVIFKVENRINRFKRLLELKESKIVLEHEAKRLHVTLKHLDLFLRGQQIIATELEK